MTTDPRPLTPEELRKIEVETRKLEAEIEREERRAAYEEHKADAESAKLLAETREARLRTKQAEIDLARAEREERKTLATNEYHHVYHFIQTVTESSALACIKQIAEWRRNDSGCDIEIVFSSPGGSVMDGMMLFDYIQETRRAGHKVTTTALGMAASMAGILLQAGDLRRMGREAVILIHQISAFAAGRISEIEDEVKLIHKMQDRILDIFASRARQAGENGTASQPLTRAQFKKRWERVDWWSTSDECLKWGIVDELL